LRRSSKRASPEKRLSVAELRGVLIVSFGLLHARFIFRNSRFRHKDEYRFPAGNSLGISMVKRRFSGIFTVCSKVITSPQRQDYHKK
jgi:hypothetical protein